MVKMEEEPGLNFYEKDEEKSDDDSIYSEKVMGELLDDDELSAAEEGFMVGYLDA